jgi:hypothetical protein
MAVALSLFCKFAICSVLLSTFMNASVSPFAIGCNGVILSCSKPSSMVKFVKSMELNGGPLSLSNLLGMPCVAKIFLSFSPAFYNIFVINGSTVGARRVSDGREIHRDASKFKLANVLVQEDDENGPPPQDRHGRGRTGERIC